MTVIYVLYPDKEGGFDMQIKRNKLLTYLSMAVLFLLACPTMVLAAEEEAVAQSAMYATFWALIPPVVAIALALITKEVYSSLFI